MKATLFLIVIFFISYGVIMMIHTPLSAQYPTYLNSYPYYSSQSTYQSHRNMPYQTNVFYRQMMPFGGTVNPYNSYPYNFYNRYTGYPSSLTRGSFATYPNNILYYLRLIPFSSK